MIILNTTFFAEEAVAPELLAWLRNVYVKAVEAAGLFTGVELVRVLEPSEPGAVSFACRCGCGSLDAARSWHDSSAVLVRDELKQRWGQRVLWFTTYMERP